jgi:hypothetical protein
MDQFDIGNISHWNPSGKATIFTEDIRLGSCNQIGEMYSTKYAIWDLYYATDCTFGQSWMEVGEDDTKIFRSDFMDCNMGRMKLTVSLGTTVTPDVGFITGSAVHCDFLEWRIFDVNNGLHDGTLEPLVDTTLVNLGAQTKIFNWNSSYNTFGRIYSPGGDNMRGSRELYAYFSVNGEHNRYIGDLGDNGLLHVSHDRITISSTGAVVVLATIPARTLQKLVDLADDTLKIDGVEIIIAGEFVGAAAQTIVFDLGTSGPTIFATVASGSTAGPFEVHCILSFWDDTGTSTHRLKAHHFVENTVVQTVSDGDTKNLDSSLDVRYQATTLAAGTIEIDNVIIRYLPHHMASQ